MKKFIINVYKNKNVRLLAFFFVAGGVVSVFTGQDNYYDLLNYHFYNAFALLNGRYGTDIIPAGMHTFLNPLADVPYYLMLMHMTNFPRVVAFLMGIPYAVCAFFAVKIVFLVFKPAKGQDKYYALAAALLGVTGVMALGLCGASSGDLQTGMFILAAVYIILRNKKILWLSGLLLGLGFGMKLTNGPIVAGFFIAALLYLFNKNWKEWLKNCFILGMTFLAGFFITNGFFMWRLWRDFQNPFFPFFNNIFKSSWFASQSAVDNVFIPQTLAQIISLPLTFGRSNTTTLAEVTRDLRLAFGTYFSFFVLFDIIIRKFKKGKDVYSGLINEKKLLFVAALWVVAYVFWLKMFAVMRYLVVPDFMVGVMLTAFFIRFINLKDKLLLFILITGIIVGYTVYPDWHNIKFRNKTVIMSDTKIKDGALVLFFSRFSYLVPFSNPNAVYIGLNYNPIYYPDAFGQDFDQPYREGDSDLGTEIYKRHNFRPLIQKVINAHNGPIYIVEPLSLYRLRPEQLAQYGLKIKQQKRECNLLKTNMYWPGVEPVICEVQKGDVTVDPSSQRTFK